MKPEHWAVEQHLIEAATRFDGGSMNDLFDVLTIAKRLLPRRYSNAIAYMCVIWLKRTKDVRWSVCGRLIVKQNIWWIHFDSVASSVCRCPFHAHNAHIEVSFNIFDWIFEPSTDLGSQFHIVPTQKWQHSITFRPEWDVSERVENWNWNCIWMCSTNGRCRPGTFHSHFVPICVFERSSMEFRLWFVFTMPAKSNFFVASLLIQSFRKWHKSNCAAAPPHTQRAMPNAFRSADRKKREKKRLPHFDMRQQFHSSRWSAEHINSVLDERLSQIQTCYKCRKETKRFETNGQARNEKKKQNGHKYFPSQCVLHHSIEWCLRSIDRRLASFDSYEF